MGSKLIHGITCLLFLEAIFAIEAKPVNHDVKKFGAKGDGKTDDTQAFSLAWKEACKGKGEQVVVVPKGKYIVGPIEFAGPCQGDEIEIAVEGTVQSSEMKSITGGNRNNAWITFEVDNLVISGDGTFDGRGRESNCTKCSELPLNLLFYRVHNAQIEDITTINSNSIHIGVFESSNVTFEDVTITDPGLDGFLIQYSSKINITGADISLYNTNCVTIKDGTSEINVEKMTCHNANGLAIGVLGNNTDQEKPVTGVTVRNSTFSHTEGAIRIQSWAASNSDIAISNLVFEDIFFDYLQNIAIILDQEHCPSRPCRRPHPSKVKVSNVSFKNIKGTTVHPNIVILECGTAPGACKDIKFSDMRVLVEGDDRLEAQFTCKNVKPALSGKLDPAACSSEDES